MPNVHYNKNKIITFLVNTEHMTQKQPKKTIGYLRVSTDRQDLEKNKADILSFANQADLGRVVFVEEKASGKISWRNRKIVNILDDLGAGDVLIVSELSRLGRSMLECMEILSIAAEQKIRVFALKGNWRLDQGKRMNAPMP